MSYRFIFFNDPKLIGAGVVCLTIISIALIIQILSLKSKFLRKHLPKNVMITIMFFLALIIGISISWSNGFKVFDEYATGDQWIKELIYLMGSFVNISITIMFFGFLIILPFRFFCNIYMFLTYRDPFKKFIKSTVFYLFFGSIALIISAIQYFMQDSFFMFSSNFSNNPHKLDFNYHPTLFYVANFLLIKIFEIKAAKFSFFFVCTVLTVILIEFIIIKLLYNYNNRVLKKMIYISEKVSSVTKYLSLITPIFTFTALVNSLMVQTIATFLRIILVILMMVMLMFVIYLLTIIYSLFTKQIKFKEFNYKLFEVWKYLSRKQVSENLIREMSKDKRFEQLEIFNKEQAIYNIFLTAIFPLILSSYLGFSSGPLFSSDFKPIQHIFFWTNILIIGYLLMFAYAFRFSDALPYKMVLTNSCPYIRSGFNTGILSYFNNVINKLSMYATFSTFIAITCKHKKQYRKLIA